MFVMRYILMGLLVTGFAVASSAFMRPAIAQGAAIDAAKDVGIVGEQIDGYLGIVEPGAVDASLRRRVNEINARRTAAYDELAESSGATRAQVARVTGEKQLERAARGEFIMDETGRWVRKGS